MKPICGNKINKKSNKTPKKLIKPFAHRNKLKNNLIIYTSSSTSAKVYIPKHVHKLEKKN